MRISAHVSPELRAVITRISELPTAVRKELRVQTKAAALPIWQEEVRGKAGTRLEVRAFANTARVAVTDTGVRLQAARIGKPLSGGLNVRSQWQGIEFGADDRVVRRVDTRSSKGTAYTATRRTQRQFRPRQASGYVVYPALSQAIPRLLSLWVQTVARTGREALEGRR